MKFAFRLLSFLFLLCSSVVFSRVPDEFPLLNSAHCGILIKSLSGDSILFSHQNNKSFTPASVMKLVTTATALEKLGPDFHYKTELKYSGRIEDGVLYGDLIIVGSGDPTLGSKFFSDVPAEFVDVWVKDVKALGITSVLGTVVSDASVFDKQVIPDKWIWEDIGNYYGAGCYGLSCFDNTYSLFFSKTAVGETAKVDRVSPECSSLSFESHVKGADIKSDNAYIYGSPWGSNRSIYGTIPAGRESFKIKGALPSPPKFLADFFLTKLEANGISVKHPTNVVWSKGKRQSTAISACESPSLVEIISVTNKHSNNLYAEHVFKTIFSSSESSSTVNLAVDSLISMWSNSEVHPEGVKIYDGSGMSRASLITPDFIVGVLEYMSASENWTDFHSSLAVAGQDGTFKYFLDGTALQGITHGKSGTMSGVRCYAGVVEKSTDERAVFCVLVNNFTTSSAAVRAEIESFLCSVLK